MNDGEKMSILMQRMREAHEDAQKALLVLMNQSQSPENPTKYVLRRYHFGLIALCDMAEKMIVHIEQQDPVMKKMGPMLRSVAEKMQGAGTIILP